MVERRRVGTETAGPLAGTVVGRPAVGRSTIGLARTERRHRPGLLEVDAQPTGPAIAAQRARHEAAGPRDRPRVARHALEVGRGQIVHRVGAGRRPDAGALQGGVSDDSTISSMCGRMTRLVWTGGLHLVATHAVEKVRAQRRLRAGAVGIDADPGDRQPRRCRGDAVAEGALFAQPALRVVRATGQRHQITRDHAHGAVVDATVLEQRIGLERVRSGAGKARHADLTGQRMPAVADARQGALPGDRPGLGGDRPPIDRVLEVWRIGRLLREERHGLHVSGTDRRGVEDRSLRPERLDVRTGHRNARQDVDARRPRARIERERIADHVAIAQCVHERRRLGHAPGAR